MANGGEALGARLVVTGIRDKVGGQRLELQVLNLEP